MSVSLAELVARLEAAVPARDDVPSAAQYEQCVLDAAADFGRRLPQQTVTTISVVSGTATYALPDDLVLMIVLESLQSPTGIVISGAGLIPTSSLYKERIMVAGGQLRIYPTPEYTLDRVLWYGAGHVPDATGEFPLLSDAESGIVMLRAHSLALQLIANTESSQKGGWKYQIGDEMVDKSSAGKSFQTQANEVEKAYQNAVKAAIGAAGARSEYLPGGYSRFV